MTIKTAYNRPLRAKESGPERESGGFDGPVSPDRVRIGYDRFHRLWLRVDDREYMDVQPRRVFPVSKHADYVSFLSADDEEILLLAHPDKLERASRKALRRALARMYFRAKILRVYRISEISGGVCQWHVRTDRGYASFEVVERNDRIRYIPPGRYLITDVDGNRFEIGDIYALDTHSRTEVFRET